MQTVKTSSGLDVKPALDAAQPSTPGTGKAGLIGGALAGIGASVCCLGPLVLVSVGLGGAWVANLAALEPYRWAFILAALGFLGHAWRRIYRPRPAAQCEPGSRCAVRQARPVSRILFWVVSALVLAGIVSPYFAPLFQGIAP